MTRRIQPPPYPNTGNPPVENKLRSAWREYRDFITKLPPLYAHYAIHQGAPDYETENPSDRAANYYTSPPHQYGHRLPRKKKKCLVKNNLAAAFQYLPAAHYTPEKILL